MKYRLRNISKKYLWIGVFLVIPIILFTASFNLLENRYINEDIEKPINENKTEVKEVKKSKKITKYIEDLKEKVVEDVDINKEVSSVLVNEDNGSLKAHLFNYETGEEINIDNIVKEDQKILFEEKVKELIYLKYPAFIADIISLNDKRNEYFWKENELVIYFYDYEITPMINEVLSLRVNYNEIKDYLNMTVKLDSEYQNEDGSVINKEKKLIAITFDDGPSGYTKSLVDLLNKNKVNATFFMVTNKLANYRDTVLYVHNNGNEIGYHSYKHSNFKRQSIEEVLSEYEISNELLKSITGTELKLTRPPYGSINEEVKNALNTSFIMWNIDTNDWRYHDSEYLKNHVLENAKAGDIVLFHDMYKASIEAIEKLLPELYVRGYQVVTVSDLANAFNTTLESNHIYSGFTK